MHRFISAVTIVLFIIVTLFIYNQSDNVSTALAQEKNSKTQKHLHMMEEQKIILSIYASSTDPKLQQAIKITNDIFEKALNIGANCRTETDEVILKECDKQINDLYVQSKTPYRLTKYYAIMAGFPSVCTKADLGTGEKLYAVPIQTNVSKGGNRPSRLFLCSGSQSSKETLDIKWRVQAANGKLVRTRETIGEDVQNLLNKTHVAEAEKELGIK